VEQDRRPQRGRGTPNIALAWAGGGAGDIDRSTATRLLRGKRKLNTHHIRKTAEALHIDAGLMI